MGEFVLPPVLAAMADRSRITSEDVSNLRQEVYVHGLVSPEDAVAIMALDTACRDKSPEWNSFFREFLSDFIVEHTEPSGSVSEKNARWLISAVSRDGNVASRTELEMIVDVLCKSQNSPDFLSAYALKQVADAILKGKGPLMKNRVARRDVVLSSDVEMMRQILCGNPAYDMKPVSRTEVEVLFIINDRTIEAQNDPAWHDLFVKAVANFVMGVSGYSVPARAEALEPGVWIGSASQDARVATIERMMETGVKDVLKRYIEIADINSVYNRRSAERLELDRTNGIVHVSEAQWLVSRIGQGGFMRRNERALLGALREMESQVHPELRPLLSMVA